MSGSRWTLRLRGAGRQAGRQARPRPQSKPCQSLCSESYSSSAPTHLTPSSSMGVPWCRSARQAPQVRSVLCAGTTPRLFHRGLSLALAGIQGKPCQLQESLEVSLMSPSSNQTCPSSNSPMTRACTVTCTQVPMSPSQARSISSLRTPSL